MDLVSLPLAGSQQLLTLKATLPQTPAILTYDRYNQGLTTSPDPIDKQPGKENGHSYLDIVTDLHQISLAILSSHLNLLPDAISQNNLNLLMATGVPIIRLYAQTHPNLISGAIFLDSNICNTSYSTIIPSPSSLFFSLPDDCRLEQYIEARDDLGRMFDLSVRNAENLDRTTGAILLPDADGPKLEGEPWLSVVGHDPVVFVEMGTPRSVSWIVHRHWAKYNEGLPRITNEGKSEGVVIAKGCGHFIQMDDPVFVADEISKLLKKLGW